MNGSLEYNSIQGQRTGKKILYAVYLPQAYYLDPEQNFSVLYYLHGLNENHTSNFETIARWIETGINKHILPPLVIVAPDGYENSMWVDSLDGKKPAETNLIKELIPSVEARYRVRGNKKHRIISGFSMGGFGAVRLALKYSELFSLCVSMDGALHTLKTFKAIRSEIFTEIFQEDREYFKANCVYHLSKNRTSTVRNKVTFFIAVGALSKFNQRFRKHLEEQGIKIIDQHYLEARCDHSVESLLETSGDNLLHVLGSELS
ncbi:MAG: hypothetical protein GY702_04260 [Desulfobulbaceae bacterium]|nr:hypothetical protein [Desulfobulbaceae bacterium]